MTTKTATKVGEIDFTVPLENAVMVAPAPELPATEPPTTMLSIIERASRDPNVDVEKLDRLLQMQDRVMAREAQVEFDNAMQNAQQAMKRIEADKHNTHTKSDYASYAALDRAIRPIYSSHGFSVSFSSGEGAVDQVRLICRIAHKGGHREEARLDMPADGKGAQGKDVMSKTHATGAAITYGKRYLLGMIFNLAIGEDDDGNGADGDIEALAGPDALRNKEGKLLSAYASDKAKTFTSNAIENINLSGNPQAVKDWRREQFKAPKGSNISPLAWLEYNAPSEFERVKMAYENRTGEQW